jgi:hypothetical protein
MLQLNQFAFGFFVGLVVAIILLANKLYIFYKEKYVLSQRIKRLEKANSFFEQLNEF